jgi:hypothetical protein
VWPLQKTCDKEAVAITWGEVAGGRKAQSSKDIGQNIIEKNMPDSLRDR